jgi:hypothetical protein
MTCPTRLVWPFPEQHRQQTRQDFDAQHLVLKPGRAKAH